MSEYGAYYGIPKENTCHIVQGSVVLYWITGFLFFIVKEL